MLHFKWLSVSLIVGLIAGCGSTVNKPVESTSNQPVTAQIEPKLVETPDYYLQQAQDSDLVNNTVERNQWLLRSAEAYKQQDDCDKSTKVIRISLPELTDTRLINHAHLLIAECHWLSNVSDWQKFEGEIALLDSSIGHANRIETLKSLYFAHKGDWLDAAKSLASIFDGNAQTSESIWYYLQALEQQQLEAASLREPALAPWLQLSLIVKQYGLNTSQLTNQVLAWQVLNAQHPLSLSLPNEIQLALNAMPLPTNKVAVLLPLSGRLAQQGLAIKEGALAAYFQRKQSGLLRDTEAETLIHFYDTQANDIQTLVENVKDYDVVVGPLVKDTLTQFVNAAPKSLNIVGLNRLDIAPSEASLDSATVLNNREGMSEDVESTVPGMRVFFALSPEDEAVQLAQKVFKTGALQPIVIAHQSGAAKRMADTFIQTWEELHKGDRNLPELATFTDNKSMRTGLTALLDVKQSLTRINTIRNLTSQQVHSVPRNRRDIDAIILFATPQQTELLNPIVEASLSPFNNKTVPVYASSRSFSETFSNNSLRDLRNITFTDMPWMLPGNPSQQIKQETANIWPERDDTLKRLFALGFDAYHVLQDMPALAALPQARIQGLTGMLSIDQSGNVVRLLPFGKITESEVILLAKD